jgi:hypothetical protein
MNEQNFSELLKTIKSVICKNDCVTNKNIKDVVILYMYYDFFNDISMYKNYVKNCLYNIYKEFDNKDKNINCSYLFDNIYGGYFNDNWISYEKINDNDTTWKNKFSDVYIIKTASSHSISKCGKDENYICDGYTLCKSKSDKKWNIFPINISDNFQYNDFEIDEIIDYNEKIKEYETEIFKKFNLHSNEYFTCFT